MSQHLCAACRTAPASIFCPSDAAILCTPCDMSVHDANKLARRHTRVPLSLITSLGLQLPITTNNPPVHLTHSPERSSSAETGFDESDESSALLVVPDTDDIPDVHLSPPFTSQQPSHKPVTTPQPSWTQEIWTPSVPDTDEGHLTTIAGAFVKKEAQTLFESTQCHRADSHFASPLEFPWMRDAFSPVHSRGYSAHDSARTFVEEQRVLPADRFALSIDHKQSANNDVLGCSLTTEEDSSVPVPDLSSGFRSERTSIDELDRSTEQKRLDRQAALQRFRHKRANRSFRKKVRYACRKQLADSRPRVKGRFVGRSKVAHPNRIQKTGARTGMTG